MGGGSQIYLFFCSPFSLFIHFLRPSTNDNGGMTGFHFSYQAPACSSSRRYLQEWRGEGAGDQLLSAADSLLHLFATCCALLATNNERIKQSIKLLLLQFEGYKFRSVAGGEEDVSCYQLLLLSFSPDFTC